MLALPLQVLTDSFLRSNCIAISCAVWTTKFFKIIKRALSVHFITPLLSKVLNLKAAES